MKDEIVITDSCTEPPKRNIRLDLEYDGRDYCGWQWQPKDNNIEAVVKQAVEEIVDHPITLYSCGRTDAGVHAEQHVAHFYSHTTVPCTGIMRGMNAILPDDIAVYCVSNMPLEWKARHNPYEREYRYTFWCSASQSAHFHHRTYWVHRPLNVEHMNQAAAYLVGEHDFSAFRSSRCSAKNAVRCIFECRVIDQTPLVHLKIRGTAFLRHQVRTIAGTLLKVGQGKYHPDYVKEILDSKDRSLAAPTLNPKGLTLVAVRYQEDEGLNLVRPSVFRID